ncbi:MAG TPA: A/G-specific adenine glycosylase [Chthoniobacterales bacterium]
MERLQMRTGEYRQALLKWYRNNGRDLPWRHTRDPYQVLVSEFMLQQTQVATVLPYYKEWFRRFPSFAALARSSETEVVRAWQGLGYYARARNLHATAKLVVDKYRGRFPRELRDMRELPGIGKYTAHAVAAFAFDQSVPIVEANSARVLARLFNLRIPIDSTAGQRILWDRAASMVPSRKAGAYNSALLDLGALICLPRTPKCGICPVKKFCRARNPEELPMKRPRPQTKWLVEKHAFVTKDGKLLLIKAAHRWRGMWILPQLADRLKRPALQTPIHASVFPFTNHQITLQIFSTSDRMVDTSPSRWFSKRQLASIPIPSPHRRVINALLN